jgi:hypothetical protein
MILTHSVAPIPAPLWGANLRKVLKPSEWQNLRKRLLAERGSICQTCGLVLPVSSKVQAHEDWEYNVTADPAVAHLKGVLLSCWHCHAIEHFGVTTNLVRSGRLTHQAIDDTIAHFCKLNSSTPEEFEVHRKLVFERWESQNELNWIVDWGDFLDQIQAAFDVVPFSKPVKLSDLEVQKEWIA